VIGASTSLAFSALLRNKLRSALTMLGIVIGVGAVILMQSMGRGATAWIAETISGLGSNMLVVIPGTSQGMGAIAQGVPLFTLNDVDAIRSQARDVGQLTAASQRVLRLVAGSNNRTSLVAGVTPEYFNIRMWGVSSGRLLNETDERTAASVCVIGQTVSDILYVGSDPLGRDLRVRNIACRVVGVLDAKGSTVGSDQDDIVFLPFSTFSRRIMGSERVGAMMASAVSQDRIDAAKDQLLAIMRRRRHILAGQDDDFTVRDPREMQAVLQGVTGMLTSLLAGVAAISLVVGGIGIMNIMLVSVTERTREIGIRLALGARSRDVLMQFLVEAVALSAAGGLIGILLGLALALGAARILHFPFVVPGSAAPIAFGVSLVIGVIFGVVPARKAARLNPLTALRFE
jgi:putative ABC transport system permease protein